jgi:hypothetical protein
VPLVILLDWIAVVWMPVVAVAGKNLLISLGFQQPIKRNGNHTNDYRFF